MLVVAIIMTIPLYVPIAQLLIPNDASYNFFTYGVVLIGENSVICRGTIDDTIIGDGVRIDALTQVSHNCVLEKNTVLVAGCRLCGSVHLKENAYLAGAIVRNQCVVEEDALAGLGAVIVKNVPAGETVVGNPARPLKKKEG